MQRGGKARQAVGGIRIRDGRKKSLSAGDFANRKEQRGIINLISIRVGLAFRIFGESLEQIPFGISGEGLSKSLALRSSQREVLQVKNGWVVQAPLQNIVGLETRGCNGSFSGFGEETLPITERKITKLIRESDLAFDNPNEGSVLTIRLNDKFGTI